MTQNITDAKQNFKEEFKEEFEKELLKELNKENKKENKKENIINIDKSDILSYILLLDSAYNKSFYDKIRITKLEVNFNIFRFITLSDFNIKQKYDQDLYKQKDIPVYNEKKLNDIFNVLKNSKEISNILKNFFDLMNKLTTTTTSKDSKSEISAKISEINKIKDLSIKSINEIELQYFNYVNGSNFSVVHKLDVINFINYLADEYINESIEGIYVGTFKSDVKNLIDEICKEGGGDREQKDLIIKKNNI